MAGLPWFELDVDMPDDPKCKGLGARLKNPLAFGYAVRLYAYCYRHAQCVYSGPGAVSTVEDAAGWKGRPGVLFGALKAEGFLDTLGPESVEVHGIAARLGPHLAKLERDRVRAKERRDSAEKSLRRPGDVHATSERNAGDVRGDRDSNRDIEASEKTSVAVLPAPKPRALDVLREEWDREYPLAARLLAALDAAGLPLNRPRKPDVTQGIERSLSKLTTDAAVAAVSRAYADDPNDALGWYAKALARAANGVTQKPNPRGMQSAAKQDFSVKPF